MVPILFAKHRARESNRLLGIPDILSIALLTFDQFPISPVLRRIL